MEFPEDNGRSPVQEELLHRRRTLKKLLQGWLEEGLQQQLRERVQRWLREGTPPSLEAALQQWVVEEVPVWLEKKFPLDVGKNLTQWLRKTHYSGRAPDSGALYRQVRRDLNGWLGEAIRDWQKKEQKCWMESQFYGWVTRQFCPGFE